MNSKERDAIISIFPGLSRDIQIKYIRSALIKFKIFTLEDCLSSRSSQESSENEAEIVLLKMLDLCSVSDFVQILQHNNSYNHLASEVLKVISEACHGDNVSAPNTGNKPTRINIFNGSRKKVKNVAHCFKRLIHFGNLVEFQRYVEIIQRNWQGFRNNPRVDIHRKAEAADLMFTALDCQLANMRIKNDPVIYNHRFFNDMLEIIPFTSNPILSSMAYIARHGAAVILREPLDHGLSEMMHAKMHSEMIVPCKEAGMVYYQEIDIMVRKYETDTTDHMKNDMLDRCRLALNQFDEESSAVKEDFSRMLFLRMANIYLGINVSGSVITTARVVEEDLKNAETCLKMVKTTWKGMDTRRKMFYYIAKAVLNQARKRPDIALVKSKLAMELANHGNFNNEKLSIETLIQKSDYEFAASNERELEDTLRDLEAFNIIEETP